MRISDWSSDVCSSDLHPRYEYLQGARVAGELIPRVIELARAARRVNVPLMIDAEECDRLEPHLDVYGALIDAGVAAGWTGLGIVIQTYQKRATEVIRRSEESGVGNACVSKGRTRCAARH